MSDIKDGHEIIKSTMSNLTYLLKDISFLRKKVELRNINTERFNIFTCLRSMTDEVELHSRFISSIVDPHGYHGLGYKPLDNLINILGLKSSFIYNENSVKVFPNASNWSEHRDIDILIIDHNTKHAIIIENKINAEDSNHPNEGQLEKYFREVTEENIPSENIEVFYLTVDGHSPSDESTSTSGQYPDLRNHVKNISYSKEIASWLLLCIKDAALKPIIRETLVQYLTLIKKMTNEEIEEQDVRELIQLVSKEDNLKSLKLFLDNFKHIQWFTIKGLVEDFDAELGRRGYKVLSSISNETIDFIVHGGPKQRNVYPSFSFKDQNGFTLSLGADANNVFYFGLPTKENVFLTDDQIDSIKEKATGLVYGNDCLTNKNWIFWSYVSVPDDHKINLWNFNQTGSFRIINEETRKEAVNEHLDFMEETLKTINLKSILN